MRFLVSIITISFFAALLTAGQVLAGAAEGGKAMGSMEKMTGKQVDTGQVRQIQQNLTDKGFYAGKVDGLLGPQTMEAIRKFQQDKGLAATGNLNAETLQALEINLEKEEMLGVSPEFGEKQKKMEQQPQEMQQQQMQQQPEGKSKE